MVQQRDFDFIIVGAGTAGSILADHLSRSGQYRVLVLEAGGWDIDPLVRIPLGIGKLYRHRLHDWGFDSEPENNLHNRSLDAMRGKIIGGSHSINVMAYTRGDRGDYDRWALLEGADTWSYEDVLPYFKRGETWQMGANRWRGGAGPVFTCFAGADDPISDAWIEAGKACGFPVNEDFNAESSEGFGKTQFTIRNGRRETTARAHLYPALRRSNLQVLTGAQATRILFRGTRAVGLQYRWHGRMREANITGELILCAGAFNTPHLLMISGIGPAEHLKQFGISTLVDLPVGLNLQDHVAAWFSWHRNSPGPFHKLMRADRATLAMARAYLFGTGPASMVPGNILAFIKSETGLPYPDVEFMFRGTSARADLWFPGIRPAFEDAMAIRPALLHPKSKGAVMLRSENALDAPLIHYNFLAEPDDMKTIISGTRCALDVTHQSMMNTFRGRPIAPPPIRSDSDIADWFRSTASAVHHPCCTAAIGTVLDAQLRVRGTESLRVADASAMPSIVGAHINATVMMIAERAAEFILGAP